MKHLLLLSIIALAASACTTRKACERKFPPITITKDSIIEKTTITFRDTTIFDTVPGEKVTVFVPIGSTGSKTNGHVHVHYKSTGDGVEVECISDSLIRELELKNKEIDRIKQHRTVHQIERVVTRVPWWAWILMGVSFGGNLLYIIRLKTTHE